jgi:uncharacterized protein (TIGR02217 family)
MSGFHDVRFPVSIGLAARGGPERRTEIVERASGFEERNAFWAHSRRRWDAAPDVRSLDEAAAIVAFFEARLGRLYAFRFTDPLDHKSCNPSETPTMFDQVIVTGDGSQTSFALTKTYSDTAGSWERTISKPVDGSVLAAVDGVEATVALSNQGEMVFASAPASGATITAGYKFDVPVRFDLDRLDISVEGFKAGDLGSVPLIEVRV